MKMYEYKVEQINMNNEFNIEEVHKEIIEKLNSLGREGWELCAADKDQFYLKKEI